MRNLFTLSRVTFHGLWVRIFPAGMNMRFVRITLGVFLLAETSQAQPPRLVLPVGHTDNITTASFSPGGKWVITGSSDETAKVWDAITGKLVFDLNRGSGTVVKAVYSADERKIMTLHFSVRNSVKVWDAQTGTLLYSLRDESREKTNIVLFSPDSRFIIAGASPEGNFRKYDAANGRLLLQWEGHKATILSAKIPDEGKYLLTYGSDSLVKKWDLHTGRLLEESPFVPQVQTGIQYSTDSNYYARISGEDYRLFLMDQRTGKLAMDTVKLGMMLSVSFSADSRKMVTVSPGGIARTWDLATGQLVSEMKGHTFAGSLTTFSPDNSRFAMVSADDGIRIWDLLYGRMIHNLSGHQGRINSIDFSPAGDLLVSGSSDHTAIGWDLLNGKSVKRFSGHREKILRVKFSPDGKEVLTASADQTARTWNAGDGKPGKILAGHKNQVLDAGYSPDGKRIVTASRDHSLMIWDATTGKKLHELTGHRAQVNGIAFSNDGHTLASVSSDNTAMTWDIRSGNRIAHMNSNPYVLDMRTAHFTPDGRKLMTNALNGIDFWEPGTGRALQGIGDGGNNGLFTREGSKLITRLNNWVTVWSADSLKEQAVLRDHTAGITSHAASTDGKWIVTVAEDNSAKLWRTQTGKLLCSFYAVDESDFIVQSPDGYYMSSTGAARQLHYVTPDLGILSFDQLDVRYNRPDKVLEAIGNPDTALIRSYRRAWEKRISRLGIDTMAFREGTSIPEADFSNRENIAYRQDKGLLALEIHGEDSTFTLDRFNVWVNEVPVFGRKGISLREKNRRKLDTVITVTLSAGENRIETSISNINGTESYRRPLLVNYSPDTEKKPAVHFIGIGIDRFSDSRYDLQYSTKDIRDLAIKLANRYEDRIIIDTLFNRQVTIGNIKKLKEKLKRSGVDDRIIISYSGHGLLNKDFDYFLSTYGVNFEKPEENGLPYEELENLLDSIPARRKLMLIDACHSGEVDKEELVRLEGAPDSLIKGLKPVAHRKEGQLGMKNSFELMQNLFVNVGKSTGATIISAAGGTQFALERNDLKNGVFTFSILECLGSQPTIKISELKKRVGERVTALTGGRQVPTSRNEMLASDWEL